MSFFYKKCSIHVDVPVQAAWDFFIEPENINLYHPDPVEQWDFDPKPVKLGYKWKNAEDPTSGQISKYDILTGSLIAGIKGEFEQSDEALTTIRLTPREERPLSHDSLFFDGKGESNENLTRVGFRMRTYKSLSGKNLLVTEGYSPFKEGVAFAGKRVAYLEPIQYCYFTTPLKW